jgi:hypothetical protein
MRMRWLPTAIPILIAIIALDFALVFGFEAWRIFTSPVYGLDKPAFASLVYGIGRLADVKAQGLVKIAAFFGAVYLTISLVFALHIGSRIGALRGGRISHDLLDAGLILAVVSTLVAATPAILAGATDILVQERLPLWLVGLAATLSMIERLPEADAPLPAFIERMARRLHARQSRQDIHAVSPPVREGTSPHRWDSLRDDAGMATLQLVQAENPAGEGGMPRSR